MPIANTDLGENATRYWGLGVFSIAPTGQAAVGFEAAGELIT
jgi:hypothetical protein